MPTYEYECKKCKKHFEAFQSMTDKPLKKCKFCGGPVTRLIGSGAGVIFKGSGFYATDYRKRKDKVDPAPPACPSSGKDTGCKGCAQNKE